jgi:uncharacterized protein YaaN involved in tellurite resistance
MNPFFKRYPTTQDHIDYFHREIERNKGELHEALRIVERMRERMERQLEELKAGANGES